MFQTTNQYWNTYIGISWSCLKNVRCNWDNPIVMRTSWKTYPQSTLPPYSSPTQFPLCNIVGTCWKIQREYMGLYNGNINRKICKQIPWNIIKIWNIFWVWVLMPTIRINWSILGARLNIEFGKNMIALSSPADHINHMILLFNVWKYGTNPYTLW